MAEQRCAELMEAGVRQLGLGLDTGDLGDPELGEGSLGRVPQQRGLADAGLAADDECGTLSGPHTLAEAVEFAKFGGPAVELHEVAGHVASIKAGGPRRPPDFSGRGRPGVLPSAPGSTAKYPRVGIVLSVLVRPR